MSTIAKVTTDEAGDGQVRRVEPLDLAYLRAVEGTRGEWSSQEDDEAYSGL